MNNQTIVISDRNAVSINNVKNVNSFNENEFLVDTPFGTLKVNGKNLNIGKMDTDKQELLIKGNIDSISYLNTNKNKNETKKEGIFIPASLMPIITWPNSTKKQAYPLSLSTRTFLSMFHLLTNYFVILILLLQDEETIYLGLPLISS